MYESATYLLMHFATYCALAFTDTIAELFSQVHTRNIKSITMLIALQLLQCKANTI